MKDLEDLNLDLDGDYEDESRANVWLSISDLMSGLLLFFALLFIATQVQLQRKIQELNDYQQAFDKLPLVVLTAIEEGIGGSSIQVDPETGDVSLDDKILFAEGRSDLKPEGKAFLRQFIPIYSQVIFSDAEFDRQVVRIVIEGHTSSKGSAQFNRELSLKRSLAVADYLFSSEIDFPHRERFQEKILIAGRGEIDANPQVDDPKDRKVTFRFQLRRPDFQDALEREMGDRPFSQTSNTSHTKRD